MGFEKRGWVGGGNLLLGLLLLFLIVSGFSRIQSFLSNSIVCIGMSNMNSKVRTKRGSRRRGVVCRKRTRYQRGVKGRGCTRRGKGLSTVRRSGGCTRRTRGEGCRGRTVGRRRGGAWGTELIPFDDEGIIPYDQPTPQQEEDSNKHLEWEFVLPRGKLWGTRRAKIGFYYYKQNWYVMEKKEIMEKKEKKRVRIVLSGEQIQNCDLREDGFSSIFGKRMLTFPEYRSRRGTVDSRNDKPITFKKTFNRLSNRQSVEHYLYNVEPTNAHVIHSEDMRIYQAIYKVKTNTNYRGFWFKDENNRIRSYGSKSAPNIPYTYTIPCTFTMHFFSNEMVSYMKHTALKLPPNASLNLTGTKGEDYRENNSNNDYHIYCKTKFAPEFKDLGYPEIYKLKREYERHYLYEQTLNNYENQLISILCRALDAGATLEEFPLHNLFTRMREEPKDNIYHTVLRNIIRQEYGTTVDISTLHKDHLSILQPAAMSSTNTW